MYIDIDMLSRRGELIYIYVCLFICFAGIFKVFVTFLFFLAHTFLTETDFIYVYYVYMYLCVYVYMHIYICIHLWRYFQVEYEVLPAVISIDDAIEHDSFQVRSVCNVCVLCVLCSVCSVCSVCNVCILCV